MQENWVLYSFYSLAFNCAKIKNWLPFLQDMGYDAVYFTPIFESTHHGYDTKDYRTVDRRFGTNSEFVGLVDDIHAIEIDVIIDGVFNHVGRDFWAFQDVLTNRENSQYKEWFYISFDANTLPDGEDILSSQYFSDDNLNYRGWEGNFDLVALNHECEEVTQYLIDTIHFWSNEFKIDGVRLDVAYSLPTNFLKRLADEFRGKLYFIGEQIHGDYNRILDAGIDSVTDYNLYKAIWSSVKDRNLFEANWTLEQHQKEYPNRTLMTFLDNHDTDRIASRYLCEDGILDVGALKAAYYMLFTLPGIPCIYYGSEFADVLESVRQARETGVDADLPVRQPVEISALEESKTSELCQYVKSLISLKKSTSDLASTHYEKLELTNTYLKFKRGGSEFEINL